MGKSDAAKAKPKAKAKSKAAAKARGRKGLARSVRGSTVSKRPAAKAKVKAAPAKNRRKASGAEQPARQRKRKATEDGDTRKAKARARKALKTVAVEKESQEPPGEPGEPNIEEDSDFNSSDLDPVLWAVGGQPLEESGKAAERINQRRQNKKKKLRRKAEGQKTAVQRAREKCQATPEARALLARGHAQYSNGDFADAIETMKAAIREQPGLADPYHVLHLIHTERGEEKKALDALLLSAYFTSPSSEARPVWRKVADLSLRLGQIDQACYAFRRCIPAAGSRSEDDWKSLWQLSQLLFKKDSVDKGIEVLFELYEETQEPKLACEVAKKLVQRHRWKECVALLEVCVDRGRKATPPRIDLNVLNILAEVLIELRDFEKCAKLLKELLHLTPSAQRPASGRSRAASSSSSSTALALIPAKDTEALMKRLHNSPVDLVAKLGAALCQITTTEDGEDPCCKCAIEVVLSHPADSHQDLYLLLVDAMLADAGTTVDTVSQRWRKRANVRPWSAQQAERILDLLEACQMDEDLRERRAMSKWRLGKVEEAALLLEEVLEEPGDRGEVDLRNLRVRAAEAWIELGRSDRADQVLSTLTYEELQRSHELPPPMSAAERKKIYKELNETIETTLARAIRANDRARLHRHVGSLEELKAFISKFRHLVYDCELDYKRLSAHSANQRQEAQALAEPLALDNEPHETEEADEEPVKRGWKRSRGKETGKEAEAGSEEALALVVKQPVKGNPRPQEDTPSQAFTSYRWKRRHLGLDSIEDMFGFEAYISMVKTGVEITRCYALSEKNSKSREGVVQAARAVELCELIISNRRLVSVRNPVKRRLVRDLAMTSLLTGFEARLWKVVFKHLRLVCDRHASPHLLAFFSRILFAHADVDGLSASPAAKDRGDVAPWEHEKTTFSSSGHRNTYAAAFTDVRGWALRKLLKRPRDFGLTLLCAHFCIIASQYPFAVAEYSRAHRLAPFEPLPALCTATAYISFAMSRAAARRHDLILKGLAFLQRYRRLRLRAAGLAATENEEDPVDSWGGLPAERQSWEEDVLTDPLDCLAIRAEVAYNYGRAFHQLSMSTLAVEAYQTALSCFDGMAESPRADLLVLRRSAAYNLAVLFKAQGALTLAADVLWRHVVFG